MAGTAGTGEATRGATGHATRHTASTASTVELHHDGVGNTLKLLLVLLVLLTSRLLILIEPVDNLVDLSLESLLVRGIKLLVNLRIAESVAQRVGV
jgi:hypothetical protein